MSDILKQRQQYINHIRKRISKALIYNTKIIESKLKSVGIVGGVGFLLYYWVWAELFSDKGYYESFPLRILCSLLCFGLTIFDRLPDYVQKYLPIYWHLTLTYLTFFVFFMMLANNYNNVWLVSEIIMIFLLMLFLMDGLLIIIILLVGSMLATAVFNILQPSLIWPFENHLEVIPLILFAILGGIFFNFSYKNGLRAQERLEGYLSVSSNIAHELRTPLLTIKTGLMGINQCLPGLINAYHQAKAADLSVADISEHSLKQLPSVIDNINVNVDYSNAIINIVCVSLNAQSIGKNDYSYTSMRSAIKEALKRFPFKSKQEQQCVRLLDGSDFEFFGSKTLMINITYNMIKNALFAIKKSRKGHLVIYLEHTAQYNQVVFEDDATGIEKNIQRKIFERFYSGNEEGIGVGLAFCKQAVDSFGGEIFCESMINEYTKFTIRFLKQ